VFRLTDLLIMFPLALAARIVWAVLRPASPRAAWRVIVEALAITYVVALVQIVLGFQTLGGLGIDFVPSAHINLIPLRTIGEVARPELARGALGQVVGNILLFVPLGLFLPLTLERFRTFKAVVFAGLLASVGIELLQLCFLLAHLMNRAADVDDVILNTTGAVIGYAVWALFRRVARSAVNPRAALESES
jgi:glycopeptide antibiotics resistance protein